MEQKEILSIPLKDIAKSNTSPDTLLHKLTIHFNTNDVSELDYTKGGTNNHELEPLSSIFCDNVILYYCLPLPSNNEISIDNYVKQHLPEHTYKISRILNNYRIKVNKTQIKPTNHTLLESSIRQNIKVALQDVPLDNVLELCTNENLIQKLNEEGIFINDIDFTRDYAGVINKEDVISYLINNKDFSTEQDKEYYIISNDTTVGKNCLSFIHKTNFGLVRYKLYNKFVQMLESPSVRSNVGNHFANWISCPELVLEENIKKSLPTGLLRLEITFYIENKPITRSFIEKNLYYLSTLLPTNLIFYNSIETQWKILINQLKYNLMVVDEDNKTALFSYYINKITSKINGFYVHDADKNILERILKLFTFNLPICVLRFKRENDNILITQNCFEKVLQPNKNNLFEELNTWLVSSRQEFAPRFKIDADANSKGLVDTALVRFRVAHKTTKIPIELKNIANILDITKNKMLNRVAKKEMELENNFINNNNELLEIVRERNSSNEEKEEEHLQKGKEIEESIQNLKQQQQQLFNYFYNALNLPKKHYKKLIDFPDKETFAVYAFKDISTEHRTKRILVVEEKSCGKEIDKWPEATTNTPLQIYIANKTINDFIYNNENLEYWYEINPKCYGRNNGKAIFTITRDGYRYNKSKNKEPILELNIEEEVVKDFEPSKEEDNREIINMEEDLLMLHENNNLEFKHNPISSKCPKIDELFKSGDIIEVIDTYPYKGSNLIKCKSNGGEINCKSNRWLDDIIERKNIKFSVVVSVPKRHPIAKRKLLSFVA